MKSECLFMVGDGRVRVESCEIPEPGPGELLIETVYSSISPGTELRCLAGRQGGSPKEGWIPGYSATGVVRGGGDGTTVAPGTGVFFSGTERASLERMWGGHCRDAVVAESAIFTLGADADLLTASLARQAAIAHRGVSLARIAPGETVLVAGLGLIGQMSARIAMASGATVIGLDPAAPRRDLLVAAGVECFSPDEASREVAGRAGVIIDATGSAAALPSILALGRDLPWSDDPGEGLRYVVQGSYAESFAIPYDPAFVRETTFFVPRDVRRSGILAVLELIGAGKLPVADLLSATSDPSDAQDVYDQLGDPGSGLVTAAFRWGGAD